VTETDKASEKLITDFIRKKYPSHGILAEEGSEALINLQNISGLLIRWMELQILLTDFRFLLSQSVCRKMVKLLPELFMML
jgi:3'-phosphoadenosine 5'-phosphosulfate (PAPS) 3'-phosphatase